MDEKPLGMRVGESVFCAGYLVFALLAGLCFVWRTQTDMTGYSWACAAMTFLLGCGDAFHLVPRILHNIRGKTRDEDERRRRNFWLGLGNLVSSVTMTLFYILLFDAMALGPGLSATPAPSWVRTVLIVLAILRIALCLPPQNRWFDGDGSHSWGIYRNVPFLAMGVVTVVYLVACYGAWLPAGLVVVSFSCYMGVVLYTRDRPALGMLMIPKTVCYIWLIALFLRA
ncbi:MAG: hypothetical protein Q4A01_00485 [Coriobacteriales bacterium]|nr:hypothetical protein [Coriobacteriales bacterium]